MSKIFVAGSLIGIVLLSFRFLHKRVVYPILTA
jgi:hypothetical protein